MLSIGVALSSCSADDTRATSVFAPANAGDSVRVAAVVQPWAKSALA